MAQPLAGRNGGTPMQKIIFGAVLALAAFQAQADCVAGYFRKDGTYVNGYCRSTPNANRYDNYGSQSMGGTQRDEFSRSPATNKSNGLYNAYDNDRDGLLNGYDRTPERR
jgi:hypothetical protein